MGRRAINYVPYVTWFLHIELMGCGYLHKTYSRKGQLKIPACAGRNTPKVQPLAEDLLAVESCCGEREPLFFSSVAIDWFPMLQGMTAGLYVYAHGLH